MTAFDRLAAEVETFARQVERLGALQRRHDLLSAGFGRLCDGIAAGHVLDRQAPRELTRLRRLEHRLQRIDAEMLRLIEALRIALQSDCDG